MHSAKIRYSSCLFLLVLLGVARAAPTVRSGAATYGLWAPEFRELHVRIPLHLDPGDGPDIFRPVSVSVDGVRPSYALWYFDSTPFDFVAIPAASHTRVEVFVPVFWQAGEQHAIALAYDYGGTAGTIMVQATAPDTGGAWSRARGGGNLAFAVREEAGLDRTREVVEFDGVIERALFPDPGQSVRATRWDGATHVEIPCQVYAVESVPGTMLVHFRVAVQLSVPANEHVVVCLWHVDDETPVPVAGPLTRTVNADAITVSNDEYAIRLSSRSGQLMTWRDRRRNILFDYVDPRNLEEWARVINRTPDVYRVGQSWSHVFDWQVGQYRETWIQGPVFFESVRWGKMPFTGDELSATVRYRFTAGVPDVRITSMLSVDQDTLVLALRNGGIALTPSLFTHAAWPRQDGRIEHVSLDQALGNDTGAPAATRMPTDTPWIALWHREKGYGFGVHTIRQAYYGKGPQRPSMARQQAYVSVYRHRCLYTIRSLTQTYQADIRSLPVPLSAGTELYEVMIWSPFTLAPGEGTDVLQAVEAAHARFTHPLVVIP